MCEEIHGVRDSAQLHMKMWKVFHMGIIILVRKNGYKIIYFNRIRVIPKID